MSPKEKMESFWPKKVESPVELKFDPGFRVIGEYLSQIDSSQFFNWLSISSQFDLNILQLLGIPSRILLPPVTQFFRSKWLLFSVRNHYSVNYSILENFFSYLMSILFLNSSRFIRQSIRGWILLWSNIYHEYNQFRKQY